MTYQPLVLCGPSGCGKSTLVKKLMEEFKGCFAFSVSHTTRKPREGEEEGKGRGGPPIKVSYFDNRNTKKYSRFPFHPQEIFRFVLKHGCDHLASLDSIALTDYYYVSREEMQRAISNNEFIEHAEFSANIYGTSKKVVEDITATGRICILDIDMQGVKSVKETDLNPRYIFIAPPNEQVLEQRLRGRGTETEEAIQRRLKRSKVEMEFSKEPDMFHHIIVNDDLDVAYEKLKGILIKDIDEITKAKYKQH